jgi:hypothetical protein
MKTIVVKTVYKVIAVLIVGLLLFIGINKYRTIRYEKALLENQLSYMTDSTKRELKRWKDDNGKLHTTIRTLQVDNEQIGIYTKLLEKDLHVKAKQIKNLSKMSTKTIIKKELVTEYKIEYVKDTFGNIVDSSYGPTFVYKDDYADIMIEDTSIYLQLTDTFRTTTFWRRKNFLSSKKYYTDVSNTNPYTTITEFQAIETLNPRKVKFILGPSVGIGYTPSGQIHPFLGINAMWYPLTLKIR